MRVTITGWLKRPDKGPTPSLHTHRLGCCKVSSPVEPARRERNRSAHTTSSRARSLTPWSLRRGRGEYSGELKDSVLLGLRVLAASADAFPPLKGALCGLIFISQQVDVCIRTPVCRTYADLFIQLFTVNRSQMDEMYENLDGLVGTLIRLASESPLLASGIDESVRTLEKWFNLHACVLLLSLTHLQGTELGVC